MGLGAVRRNLGTVLNFIKGHKYRANKVRFVRSAVDKGGFGGLSEWGGGRFMMKHHAFNALLCSDNLGIFVFAFPSIV